MRLTDVSFRYRRRDPSVIREVRARLSPGDVIELTGVNGAGKSTLLRLLAGLLTPTGGAITDRPATVGLAPDRFPVEQPFTVAGYLDQVARICGGRWRPWAERLTMDHLLPVRLRELSKGSAHKVGLAQALMAEPGLLLLDEPFAGLDADTQKELPPIVADLSARGVIIVASDHQHGLRHLPSLRHWTLTDGRLTEDPPTAEPALATPGLLTSVRESTAGTRERADVAAFRERGSDAEARERGVVVEVTVPAGEVGPFVKRMRDEGYPARPARAEETR